MSNPLCKTLFVSFCYFVDFADKINNAHVLFKTLKYPPLSEEKYFLEKIDFLFLKKQKAQKRGRVSGAQGTAISS